MHSTPPLSTVRHDSWHRDPVARQARADRFAHTQRCRSLPPVQADEAQRLVAAFLAAQGGPRHCPTAYAVALQGA